MNTSGVSTMDTKSYKGQNKVPPLVIHSSRSRITSAMKTNKGKGDRSLLFYL